MGLQRIEIGYIRGKPFDLLVVERDGKLIETATAVAFEVMAKAASRDGLHLSINSGFRTIQEQQKIWTERLDPVVRALKGGAAKPGWSNHQSGMAIDISVNMSVADLRAGRKTKVYQWLEVNAATFGFLRTVPSEPWHWERVPHVEDRT